jgi:hypothetical protein
MTYFEPSRLLLHFKNKIDRPFAMLTRQAQTVSGRVPGIALSDDRTWPDTSTIRCANESGSRVSVA